MDSLVSLSKSFKDKRQRRNFLTFILSLIIQGSPFLSLASQITQRAKNWSVCLCLFLNSKSWSAELSERIRLKFTEKAVKDLKFIILDFTALVKTGRHFEYLSSVYDGRDGKIKDGYSLLCSLGIDESGLKKIPLLWKLISYEYKFRSHNLEIRNLLSKLNKWLKSLKNKNSPIFLADRGFDIKTIISWFLKNDYQFFIRANTKKRIKLKDGTIYLLSQLLDGIYENAEIICWKLKLKIIVKTEMKRDEGEKFVFLAHPDLEIQTIDEALELYAKRWKIEDLIKELKQNYGLEKFRVRKFEAIKKILSLTSLAYQVVQAVNLRCQNLTQRTLELVFQANQYFQRSIYSLRNPAQKVSFFGLTDNLRLQLAEIRANGP